MSERTVTEKMIDGPNTVPSLCLDFRKLGVEAGMTVLLHSSLSSLGWVCGGPVAVILALETVLTESGTLVMPTHSSDISDPAHWSNPPVPESWWAVIRNEMPAFDKNLTPTREMGKIPETFRKQDGVVRSSHPSSSFAAWGKNKDYIIQDRHYDFSMNDRSPLGRLYELNGFILLLGVDYPNNTSFHLAEYRAGFEGKQYVKNGFPVIEDGCRQWKEFDEILFYADDFPRIGEAYEKNNRIFTGRIGQAQAKLIDQKGLVDFSVSWMEANRKAPGLQRS